MNNKKDDSEESGAEELMDSLIECSKKKREINAPQSNEIYKDTNTGYIWQKDIDNYLQKTEQIGHL